MLLVADSPYFRNILAPTLSAAGYQVTLAPDMSMAMRLCDAGEDFDVIVNQQFSFWLLPLGLLVYREIFEGVLGWFRLRRPCRRAFEGHSRQQVILRRE